MTQSIINPLTPWVANYEEELQVDPSYPLLAQVTEAPMWHWLPETTSIIKAFRKWTLVSQATSLVCFVAVCIALPLLMSSTRLTTSGLSLPTSLTGIGNWIWFVNFVTIVAGVTMVGLPLVQQIYQITVALSKDRDMVRRVGGMQVQVEDISRHPSIFPTKESPTLHLPTPAMAWAD